MASRIITDPKRLTREQVPRPSRSDLEDVAQKTYEAIFDLARTIRNSSTLQSTPYFRRFVVSSIEALANKLFVIKRIGSNYIPEVGSILRDLTEVVVDLLWVTSHFENQPADAERLSHQFFLSSNKQFLAQEDRAFAGLQNDIFLSKFVGKRKWKSNVSQAKKELKGIALGDNWRLLPGAKPKEYKWEVRCKRASEVAERIANLKAAPYHQNLKQLSSYTHWDSQQVHRFDQDFCDALFDRMFNIAIGMNHDVITVSCKLSSLEVPERCIVLRQRFVYMST